MSIAAERRQLINDGFQTVPPKDWSTALDLINCAPFHKLDLISTLNRDNNEKARELFINFDTKLIATLYLPAD